MRLARKSGKHEWTAPVLHVGSPEAEHRFLVTEREAQWFVETAARHLREDIYDRVYPINHVVTTYYDTEDRELFRSNLFRGRDRIRVRQYAAAASPSSAAIFGEVCAFELKCSTAESRRKARLIAGTEHIEHILVADGWRSDPDLMTLAPMMSAARSIGTGQMWPALTTWFRRRSFTGDGVRVTLDEDVLFTQPTRLRMPGERGAPGAIITHLGERVLEVKRSVAQPEWLDDAMRGLKRAPDMSKYREGMLAAQRMEVLAAAARAPGGGPQCVPDGEDIVFEESAVYDPSLGAFERDSPFG